MLQPEVLPEAQRQVSANSTDLPLVAVVILNTNRRKDTLECLASLSGSTYPNTEIFVLDNASTDGSVDAIQESFPDANIMHLPQNLGYAGNNNYGIEAAMKSGAEWILVLNEDTVLAPECLEQLVRAGESDPRIGFLGPLVMHYDEPNVIQSAGGTMDQYWAATHIGQNEPDCGQYDRVRPVDWISGCAIFGRRQMIEEIGGLDARFFYYWEETEWCVRARRHGWHVAHVPAARLWHKGVQRDYRPNPNVTYYNTRNRMLMMSLHGAPPVAWLGAWTSTVRTMTSWSLRPKWRKEKREHRAALRDGVRDFMLNQWGKRAS